MEHNVEMLAMHRVLKEGGPTYRAITMDAQEVAERRAYMRRMLRDFPEWCNADNNTLDEMLLYSVDNGMMVKDACGNEYYMPSNRISLINDRYINRKPTIYTSNTPIDKLKMDERITDRIESNTYLLTLPEESVRKRIRQQEKNKLLNEIEKIPVSATNTDKDQAQPEP